MGGFEIEQIPFVPDAIRSWPDPSGRLANWPVVYTINDTADIYVGETANALTRMRQHLANPDKRHLRAARIVLDDTFNQSVCFDLESMLIQWFSGDGHYRVLNLNEGIRNLNYPGREGYQRVFREIFDALRGEGLFRQELRDIENSDLFKLSPFKALNIDQVAAIENILEGLFHDLDGGVSSTSVIQGQPGTGKTIVGIYLIKLLRDIQSARGIDEVEQKGPLSDFFAEGYPERLEGFRIGLVVPQQSLRASIARVFDRTPGLSPQMVMTPFEVGSATEPFDLLVVDEAHRLNQRANQASGPLNTAFRRINERLFGEDAVTRTQLDWIQERSRHRILLLDAEQSVRPADLPSEVVAELVQKAKTSDHYFRLATQMRVRAGSDYVGYIREVLAGSAPTMPDLGEYEFAMYDDIGEMAEQIRDRDRRHGLARLVAGYAWEWRSDPKRKGMSTIPLAQRPYDIEIEGHRWRWNSTDRDWISSPGSIGEVGSIHTVQGYDLNYAGVIVGRDLRLDESTGEIRFSRRDYFDKKGVENNPKRGIVYTDEDILRYVRNVYGVLLTRGVRGTLVYVCDPALREHLRRFIPAA